MSPKQAKNRNSTCHCAKLKLTQRTGCSLSLQKKNELCETLQLLCNPVRKKEHLGKGNNFNFEIFSYLSLTRIVFP